jgi:hypothetical protein
MARVWTPAETELALMSDTFVAYQEAGGTRSEQAWSGKRFRLGLSTSEAYAPPAIEPRDLPDPSDYEGDIAAYYEAVKAVTNAKIRLVDQPIVINWQSPDPNWTGIVFLGDIHIGGLIDYQQLEHDLALIESTSGLFCVGMGDYSERFEGAGKLQHAMAGDTVPGSDDQELLVLYALGQCRSWIAALAGNHDDFGGGEGVRRLAKHLACSYVSQAGACLKITVGSERYVLYVKHQYTGASRISTSNEGRRFWTEFGIPGQHENADVTVLAHLHQPDTHQVERKGNTIAHLRGGTYKTVDPWARKSGYTPAYGPSMVIFNPHAHEFLPFHGPNWRYGVAMLKGLRSGAISLEEDAA